MLLKYLFATVLFCLVLFASSQTDSFESLTNTKDGSLTGLQNVESISNEAFVSPKKEKNVNTKENFKNLLNDIEVVIENECKTGDSFQFNQHEQVLNHVFRIDVQLFKLTSQLVAEYFSTGSLLKNNKTKMKAKKIGENFEKKLEKLESDTREVLKKEDNSEFSGTLIGLMKNFNFIYSSRIFLTSDKRKIILGYKRKNEKIIAVEKFEKADDRTLYKNLSKYLEEMDSCLDSIGISDAVWSGVFKKCNHVSQWYVSHYNLLKPCSRHVNFISGLMEVVIDLSKVSIDQCTRDKDKPWYNTYQCPSNSHCKQIKEHGLRNGGYTCECLPTYVPLQKDDKGKKLECVKCEDCDNCGDNTCQNRTLSQVAVIILSILHALVMLCVIVSGVVLVKMRKVKTLHFSFWQLYEVMLGGALLIYVSVYLELQNESALACTLRPWCREVGFLLLYASLMLKVYRINVESKSRQAQRTLLRDKDLVKYLGIAVAMLVWQLIAWTLMGIEKVMESLTITMKEVFCFFGYWSLTLQAIEFLFLTVMFVFCLKLKPPPSFSSEARATTIIIANEAIVSAAFNLVKYYLSAVLTTNILFVMAFFRCHLTVTINLAIILGTKFWQAKSASNIKTTRHRPHETKHDPLRNQTSNMSKKSHESTDITVAGLNPDDVKAELIRLHKQLELFKSKTAKKEVTQITKKQSISKKQGPRRFSLHNFHQARRRQQSSVADEPQTTQDNATSDEAYVSSEVIQGTS